MRIQPRKMLLGLGLAGLMLAGGQVLWAEQPTLLTADEVKKLVDSGQYADALKALLRILDLKGAAAAPYDRHEMLMLRAECQLQIKQNSAALITLELVRKEAVEAKNDAQALDATGLATLVQHSPGQSYTPRTGAIRKPIPILDKTLRKAAYDALFADELAPLDAKVKAALKGTSLGPIAEAAKLLGPVRAVEHASTGDNKQTEKFTKDLTDRSLKLMGDALTDLNTKEEQINTSANRVITENVTMTDARGNQFVQQQSHRKGLSTAETQTLKGIKSDCEKIPGAASELAAGLGTDAAPFKAVATKADLLKEKANATLTDDYLNVMH